MDVFKKVMNVFGVILAWLLSIVLVIMLVASPLALSALDMLSADTITEILTGSFAQQTPPADERAADYSITRLSNVSEFVEEIPDTEQIMSGVDADAVGNVGEQMLGQLFGNQLDQQDIQTILSSDMAKDFIQFYSDGITSAVTGEPGEFQFDSDTVKDFVEDNLDEIVEIAKQVAPEYADVATEEAKNMIRKLVEENADELVKLLPRPDELVQSILQDAPELEIVFHILAQKENIKKAIVGVIVVLCVLIFLLRIPGMRGFRWLATDLFIGSGFSIVWCVVTSMGTTLLEGVVSFDATLAGIVNPILTLFAKGLIIRTAIMLASAVVLLVVYIIIKKALAKKACCVEEEVAACEQPGAQGILEEIAAEEKMVGVSAEVPVTQETEI